MEVVPAYDSPTALGIIEEREPDLVVLDVHLGRSNGLDVLKALRRQSSQVPVVMLTALDAETDKVQGLELGADDCLTKPFSYRELIARIRVQLRRRAQIGPAQRPRQAVLTVGPTTLNVAEHSVSVAGQAVALTPTEFRLLHCLMSNAGRVVPTGELLKEVWGYEDPGASDVVRVTVHRLRRKLEVDTSRPGLLQTIAGIGVLLRPDAAATATPVQGGDIAVQSAGRALSGPGIGAIDSSGLEPPAPTTQPEAAGGGPRRPPIRTGIASPFQPPPHEAREVLMRNSSASELHDALIQAQNANARPIAAAAHAATASGNGIITVFGVKGGVGKTMLATNLAVALAQESSASVALVDLDEPFGDGARMLDVRDEGDLLHPMAEGGVNDLERVQNLLVRSSHGVHVLSAPLAPDGSSAVHSQNAGPLLKRVAALYQFVLVDTPVGLNELTPAALEAAELALLVTTPELAALRRTHACLRLLQGLELSPSKLRLVLNRFESKTRLSSAEAIEALGHPVAWNVVEDYAAVQASALGKPIVLSDPQSRLSKDIRQIARDLTSVRPASGGDLARVVPPGRHL